MEAPFLRTSGLALLAVIALTACRQQAASILSAPLAVPPSMPAMSTAPAHFSPSEGEQGLLLKANEESLFTCDGDPSVRYPLLGPVLSQDKTIRLHIIQYEGPLPGGPTDLLYASLAERTAHPDLPPNSLNAFARGKQYMVEADTDLTFQCGRYLDVVYRCGDGIVEGRQFFPRIGIDHPAETCDDGNTVGGDGCSATCQKE